MEEICLFIKHYNRYIKKRLLKHSDKNLIRFNKSYPHKKKIVKSLVMNMENMVITILRVQV